MKPVGMANARGSFSAIMADMQQAQAAEDTIRLGRLLIAAGRVTQAELAVQQARRANHGAITYGAYMQQKAALDKFGYALGEYLGYGPAYTEYLMNLFSGGLE